MFRFSPIFFISLLTLTPTLFPKTFLVFENFDASSEEDTTEFSQGFAMIFDSKFQEKVQETIDEKTKSSDSKNFRNLLKITVDPYRGEVLLQGSGESSNWIETSFARTFMELRLESAIKDRMNTSHAIRGELDEIQAQLDAPNLDPTRKNELLKARDSMRTQIEELFHDYRSRWATWKATPND